MGAAAQRLTACLVCCLLAAATLQAHAKVIKRTIRTIDPLDVTEIQTALANAEEGDEINLAAGTLDITGTFFQITKGVTLTGSSSAPTTFYSTGTLSEVRANASLKVAGPTTCLGEGEGQAMLEVCAQDGSGSSHGFHQPPPSSTPVIINNITFQYGGPQDSAVAFSNGFKGIAVKMSSPLTSDTISSTISGCSFIDTDVGIEVFGAAGWTISNSEFDGSVRGVWMNSATSDVDPSLPVPLDLWIAGNTFAGFTIAIGGDVDDYLYDIYIISNTFDGTPASPSKAPGKVLEGTDIIAISLSANTPPAGTEPEASRGTRNIRTIKARLPSAAAPKPSARPVSTAAAGKQARGSPPTQQQQPGSRKDGTSDDRGWQIENNKISGVTVGVEFKYEDTSVITRQTGPAPGSLNGVVLQYNSIMADGPGCPTACYPFYTAFSPTGSLTMVYNWWGTPNPTLDMFSGLDSLGPIDPWIRTYSLLPGCTTGFCVDIGTINAVAPAITAMTITPSPAPAGSTITVAVTLQAMFDGGSLTITSTPAGVVCPNPTSFDSTTPNPIRVTCTLPQAPAMAAQAAASQAALVQTAAAVQYGKRIRSNPAVTTTQFTVTATVTGAGGTATRRVTLGVCNNQPWPFRADVDGCEGCTYNCGTGQFTCTSCRCHCPHGGYSHDQPYAQEGEQPYQQQGGYDDGHDRPSYHEEHQGASEHEGYERHEGREGTYGDKSHQEEGDHEGEQHYAEKHHEEESHAYKEYKEHHYGDGARAYDQEEDGGTATPLEDQEEDRELRVPLSQPIAPSKPVTPRSLGDVMHDSGTTDQGADAQTDRTSRDSASREEAEEGEALLREEQQQQEEREERPSKPVTPKSLSDVMLGGLADAQVASVAANHGPTVSTAAAWHPLTGAGSRGGYEQPDCSGGEPHCTCGPVPLTVTAQCSLIVYDACTNTLKCSSSGY